MPITIATSEAQITRCFPLMRELRPHLTQQEFVARVKRQQQQGYWLCCLEEEEIKALAGFRLLETLAWGKILYVDDLVTLSGA